MTKLKMTLLLAFFVALSSLAFAGTVTYSTSPSVNVSVPGLFTAHYQGVTNATASTPLSSGNNFGTLTVTCPSSCLGSGSTKFTIVITQTIPAGPPGTTQVHVQGTFIMTNGTVSVVFSPVAIHAGGNTFVYTPSIQPGQGFCSSPCTLNLVVTVAELSGIHFLPEPSAELLLGLGSLGLIGLAMISRKMISV